MQKWLPLIVLTLAASITLAGKGRGPFAWIPLGILAGSGLLYAAYRRGYADGGDEMERLYKEYPPRCRHEGCLCIEGAMQDNPKCPWHGEKSSAA